MSIEVNGPKAPKDPEKKRPGFYIMKNKKIAASPKPDGTGVTPIYEDMGRLPGAAQLAGGVTDEEILKLLPKTEDFKKLVHSIGVKIETDNPQEEVTFVLQMYGKTDPYVSGTNIIKKVPADGMEVKINLSEVEWSDDDNVVGQIRFEFDKGGTFATVSVKLYLNDGFSVEESDDAPPVDTSSEAYSNMIEQSLMNVGNNVRIKKALEKARRGEDTTIAFIGGSITQGAGAVPINNQCYSYKIFEGFCKMAGKGTDENIHYVKAGIGGTPSELGMVRYERDVLSNGKITPDIVLVEFAVNDAGDETEGECYDCLVRKILNSDNKPAIILLFAVFSNDFNLQERLAPVGKGYNIPTVSVKDAVTKQFYLTPETGRVVAKADYFYDTFHPTNLGHTIMADSVLNLLKVQDESPMDEEDINVAAIPPVYGDEFEKIRLIDKKDNPFKAVIDAGSFTGTDTDLQGVERNMDLFTTPTFPNNWKHEGNEKGDNEPFKMDIECKALVILSKDSSAASDGIAEIFVDGSKALTINPHDVGWTHDNALIVFRKHNLRKHHVEIKMKSGDENKNFTILGFGAVR